MTDPLSRTLALLDARCRVSGRLHAGGDWAMRFVPDGPVKLEAVVRGSCWLTVDDGAPSRLVAGDAVVLNRARSVVLAGAPGTPPTELSATTPPEDAVLRLGTGEDVVLVAAHVELDAATGDLFRSALPGVTHAAAPTGEAREMRRLLERIVEETRDDRPGAAFAVDQHAQLLLLEVLRAGLRNEALTHPGWLRLAVDPQLRPSVSLLHGDPARTWTLAELAAAAGMSRSHFAQRFREVAEQPPMTYLSHWRVRLAQRALRDSDVTVAVLGDRLGYASESSFSHAFSRVVGASPTRYRREVASEAGPAPARVPLRSA